MPLTNIDVFTTYVTAEGRFGWKRLPKNNRAASWRYSQETFASFPEAVAAAATMATYGNGCYVPATMAIS